MHGTQAAVAPECGATDTQPKSARIAAVCEREIGSLTGKIELCVGDDERTRLLRARADIRLLLAFATSQQDYAAWVRDVGGMGTNAAQEDARSQGGVVQSHDRDSARKRRPEAPRLPGCGDGSGVLR